MDALNFAGDGFLEDLRNWHVDFPRFVSGSVSQKQTPAAVEGGTGLRLDVAPLLAHGVARAVRRVDGLGRPRPRVPARRQLAGSAP